MADRSRRNDDNAGAYQTTTLLSTEGIQLNEVEQAGNPSDIGHPSRSIILSEHFRRSPLASSSIPDSIPHPNTNLFQTLITNIRSSLRLNQHVNTHSHHQRNDNDAGGYRTTTSRTIEVTRLIENEQAGRRTGRQEDEKAVVREANRKDGVKQSDGPGSMPHCLRFVAREVNSLIGLTKSFLDLVLFGSGEDLNPGYKYPYFRDQGCTPEAINQILIQNLFHLSKNHITLGLYLYALSYKISM